MIECEWSILDVVPPVHDDWRQAVVQCTPQCFGGAVHCALYCVFTYRGANFCIEPPRRQDSLIVAWDVLHKYDKADAKGWRELSELEAMLAVRWHEGRSAADCAMYDAKMLAAIHTVLAYRLCYTTPVYACMADRLSHCLHPFHNRLLSEEEMRALWGMAAIEAWCEAQAQACRDDEWQDQDWESAYNYEDDSWSGTEEPNKQVKHFDLLQWRGYFFNAEDYTSKIKQRRKFTHGKRREHFNGVP